MAEEFNCKPRELDEIISAEHQLLEKLRASGLSDSDLLGMVGGNIADADSSRTATESDDDISFFGHSDCTEDSVRPNSGS